MHVDEGSPGPWINYETPSRKGRPHVVTLEAKCLEEELSNNKGGNENSGTSCSTLGLLSTSTELAVPYRAVLCCRPERSANGGELRLGGLERSFLRWILTL